MKRTIIILMVLIWGQLLLSVSVQMSDGLIYEGQITGKLNGNIYIYDDILIYELPIKDIVRIVNNGVNITDFTMRKTDYSKININEVNHLIYSHGDLENLNSDHVKSKDILLKMNDREFAIYELGQRQRQAEMVSRRIDKVSNTMWSIWGVSIGVSVITIVISNL